MSIHYHPSKANLVIDALSRLSIGSIGHIEEEKKELANDSHRLASSRFQIMDSTVRGIVVTNGAESLLVSLLKEKQDQYPIFLELQANVHNQRVLTFEQYGGVVWRYQGRLCVPMVDGIQERIVEETHRSRYSIHSYSTKMYCDLREVYSWEGMKKCIAKFVAK